MKMKILPLMLLPLFLNGCMSGGAAKVITALGKDPASLRARIPTPYGVIELERTAPNSNSPPHIVSADKIEVRQQPALTSPSLDEQVRAIERLRALK